MSGMELLKLRIETPALIIDEAKVSENSNLIKNNCNAVGAKVICSIKSLSYIEILNTISKSTCGFSVSSVFEAKLAREVLGNSKNIYISTPRYIKKDIVKIKGTCDTVILNSLSQLNRLKCLLGGTEIGLRINPGLSYVKDERYDPVREFSKLGASIAEVRKHVANDKDVLNGITGIQFHTNCESESFSPLYETVLYLDKHAGFLLNKINWINFGGGYLFTSDSDYQPLVDSVKLLKDKYNLEVYLEPGKAFVKDAGYLVSSVIDIFESDGKKIAILDTTVNHAPEVFEYQYSPDVIGHTEFGVHEYILAGCSCLAGDLFGEYCFNEPLEVGSQIIFTDMAAYSLVKANMFNGINLPTIYKCSEDGSIELIKEYSYQDYRSRLGETSSETTRKRNKNTSNQESPKVISISRG